MTRPYRLGTFGVFPITTKDKKKKDTIKVGETVNFKDPKKKSMKEGGLFQRFIAEEVEDVLAELAEERAERARQAKSQLKMLRAQSSSEDADDEYELEDNAGLRMK